jgi:hypothetical protein
LRAPGAACQTVVRRGRKSPLRPKREQNLFYQLLQILSKPFTLPVRKLTPDKVSDSQVPIVTFFLLIIVYAIVTFEKINLCVEAGMETCK